ncbi:MAG: metal ABC transporter ATP-binding protein [Peptococcaceae bacterium]|nr:metal ABC transporter ATP-binding protein [Peptococcaceae bacterium]
MDGGSCALWLSGVRAGYGKAPVLNGLSLSVKKGEHLAILGENGAGKTTLFRAILHLLPDIAGTIRVLGRDVKSREDGAWVRSRVGYVPQGQGKGRLPISVFEAVMLGRWGKSFSYFRRPGARDRELTAEILDVVGLWDLRDKDCRALSGGQTQRLHIARALVREPQILLLDEPTTYLDDASRDVLARLIDQVRKKWPLTMLMIIHDWQYARRLADRAVYLRRGRIEECLEVV